MFSLADSLNPGAKATLDGKAKRLVGGPPSPTVPAGQNSLVYFVDTTNQANVFLTYYTSALAALALDPALTETDLPPSLAVSAQYGETVLNDADPRAASLESYILSKAQAVFAANGFGPATAVPEPVSASLLVIGLLGLVATECSRAGLHQR